MEEVEEEKGGSKLEVGSWDVVVRPCGVYWMLGCAIVMHLDYLGQKCSTLGAAWRAIQ